MVLDDLDDDDDETIAADMQAFEFVKHFCSIRCANITGQT